MIGRTSPRKSMALQLSTLSILLAGCTFIVAGALWLRQFDLVDLIVKPIFVITYVAMLSVIVLWRLFRDASTLRTERFGVARFLQRVDDAPGSAEKARVLTMLVPNTTASRDASAEGAAVLDSDVLSKLGMIVRQAQSTAPSDLYDQGILPSAYALRGYGISAPYGASATADLVIRIALLGTFVGIVAALAIASGGLASASPSGAGRLNEMQSVLQELLAAAAAKFWISAAGLGGAIILIVFDRYCQRSVTALVDRLGSVVDDILSDPDAARILCKPEPHLQDPIRDQLYRIAEQIRASADKWVLTVKIGGAGAADVPAVHLGPTT